VHVEVSTLIQITALLTLTMGVCMTLVARGDHANFLRLWSWAMYLHALVFVGFMARGQAPDWFTIVVANVALSSAYSCMLLAVARFNETTVKRWWLALPPLAVLLIFPWLLEQQSVRALIAAIIQGTQLALMLGVLLYKGTPTRGRGQLMLAGSLALIESLFLVRLIEFIVLDSPVPAINAPHPLQIAFFVASIIALLVSGVGVILMVLDRASLTLSFLTQRAFFLLDLPHIADSEDEPTLMQLSLEMAEELTGSQVSFIHLVNDDEATIELVTWSRRTLETYCKAVFDRHYPVNQAGIWAEALRQRRAVVFNDYASAAGRRGLPTGHAHLQRLVSLPVIENDKVVMLAGIGNKAEDYTQGDVETLQLVANDVWRLLKSKRDMRQIQRFSRMIENSRNEIFSFDSTTLKFIDANRGALKNIGYTLDELREMTPLDIKPQVSPEMFSALLSSLRERRSELVRLSTEHQRKDGSFYPVEIHIELTEEVNPVFVALVHDISERLTAEHSLKQALQVVEASPVISFRWRASDGWPVDYVSSNILRWGYRVEQLLAGTPRYAELIHPDDLARVLDEITQKTDRHIDVYRLEYRVRHADGHYFWVDDHTQIRRHADGSPAFSEGVVTDIDSRKQSEAERAANLAYQIQLNKKLEDAQNQLLQSEKMASIGQLAAGVAHELNNPIGFVHSNMGTLAQYLQSILQFTEACEQTAAGAGTADDVARLAALKRSLEVDYLKTDIVALMAESKDGLARVRKIVQDLKDFSRAGEANWQVVDIHAGIESTLNIVWNELKYKCTVDKHYASDLPPIRCLASQLNQVYMNLLVNAAQAIEDQGVITIHTQRLGDDAVRIQFSDTGKGIAPEHLRHVFDPFFTTKPVGKGTGLGLSIVWGIIGKHGGTIAVDSVLGQGTTFTIMLPVNPPEDAEPVDAPDAVPPADS
jgi:PAS domain S-box-containing protein